MLAVYQEYNAVRDWKTFMKPENIFVAVAGFARSLPCSVAWPRKLFENVCIWEVCERRKEAAFRTRTAGVQQSERKNLWEICLI